LLIDRGLRRPEATAAADATGVTTYRELDAASSRVAACLLDGGSDLIEARVAYLVAPGRDHVAIQWGIWRAGGIAVPLALSHPEPELASLLDDARPMAVIASTEFVDRVETVARARGIRVATCATALADRTHSGSLPELTADRRALMVYTRGTTGRPKGVVTTHGILRAQIATLVRAWGWRDEDRILHVLPLHHVHGIVNVLCCALWTGATCEFLPRFEPETVWERLASGEITVFMAVPTISGRLAAAWDEADDETRLRWSRGSRRLRLMVSGSAALPVPLLERWRAITGHTLLERYGMTEIGMALSNPLEGERRAGTVGHALPGTLVRLVNEAGRPVTPGTPGEIEVQGPQVFREYWDRPDETANAFRDGWFRTGDVAVLEAGYYRILGRQSTDIIKSAGYKISALEIEAALREHPDVADCAVLGVPDADLGERVVAAIVWRGGHSADVATLSTWARERLASYKAPREILTLEDLPRNAMGKVTKAVLRSLLGSGRE
jgi:malonyl-CoA/methylmalonyl-CoA synthetase